MKAKLILLIITVILSLLLGEVSLRYSGRYATYTERSNTGSYVSPFDVGYVQTWYRVHTANEKISYTNKEFSESWITNNEGLNDVQFSIPKKGKRIIVMGDSFTEGSGASSNDSSYPAILRDLMRNSLSEGTDVWNAGVGGSDLFFEYVLFRDKLLKYHPDIAIITINNTDIYETEIRGGFERFGADGKTHYKRGPWYEPLFAHSHLVRGVVLDVAGYDWSFNKKNEKEKVQDSAISLLCTAMDSFATLCSMHHIKLIFVFHPMQNELEKKEKYFAGLQIAHCLKNGYDYIDTRQQFCEMGIDSARASSIYWINDGHFNNKGYNYLAQCVWQKIMTR